MSPRKSRSASPERTRNEEFHTGRPSASGVNLEDFKLVRVIGKGCFGKIVLCQKKDTEEYLAMKVLGKQNVMRRKQAEHTKAERRILELCSKGSRCPFIVQLKYAFQTNTKLYLVLDYVPGGDLYLVSWFFPCTIC